MKTKKTWPTLYQKSSTDKTKVWKIWVEDGTYFVEHGLQDGKMQLDQTTVEIKNRGKANQTTPFDQACSEAQSKWNKKKDKGYVAKGEEQNTSVILPMLATKFTERKHDLVYAVRVQPKLNGIRCVVHTDLRFQSRLGKFWASLDHLKPDCKKIIDTINFPLDGELYIHGLALQDIGALVKKKRLGDDPVAGFQSSDLEYWVFDYIDPNTNFIDRMYKLYDVFNGAEDNYIGKVRIVRCNIACSEQHLDSWHKIYTSDGYEGTIIRNDTSYEVNKRTKNLQKRKDFLDGEYEVVGAKGGVGRFEGCATFICKTAEGLEFDCTPIGTLEQKREYLKDIDNIVGKLATIRYQELTNDKVPFHGRILSIRDYE